MDRTEIESKLTDLLVDELGIERDAITSNAKFEEDLDVDSLGVVELLMALEDEFDVTIPDEEAENLTTVGEAKRRGLEAMLLRAAIAETVADEAEIVQVASYFTDGTNTSRLKVAGTDAQEFRRRLANRKIDLPEPLADGKAQSGAAQFPTTGFVHAIKTFKYSG